VTLLADTDQEVTIRFPAFAGVPPEGGAEIVFSREMSVRRLALRRGVPISLTLRTES